MIGEKLPEHLIQLRLVPIGRIHRTGMKKDRAPAAAIGLSQYERLAAIMTNEKTIQAHMIQALVQLT